MYSGSLFFKNLINSSCSTSILLFLRTYIILPILLISVSLDKYSILYLQFSLAFLMFLIFGIIFPLRSNKSKSIKPRSNTDALISGNNNSSFISVPITTPIGDNMVFILRNISEIL